jgi:hypothetical protein
MTTDETDGSTAACAAVVKPPADTSSTPVLEERHLAIE